MYQAGFGGTKLVETTGLQTGGQAHLLKRGSKASKKRENSDTLGWRKIEAWMAHNQVRLSRESFY